MAKTGDKCPKFDPVPSIQSPSIPDELLQVPGIREVEMPHDRYVYFLYRESTLVYIGQTKNLAQRLTHHGAYTKYSRAFYIECDTDQALRLEAYWTGVLNPQAGRDFFYNRDIAPLIEARKNAKVE
jgi:hypothetical protein